MPLSPQQDILEIAQDASVLRFAPQAGGRLLSWTIDGEEVIHWPEHADWSQPAKIRGGNPLLFPFLGRHRVDGKIGYWRDAARHGARIADARLRPRPAVRRRMPTCMAPACA